MMQLHNDVLSATKSFQALVVFGVIATLTVMARAEPVATEDITGTKMPHGEILLPVRGTPAANKGYIYSFADQTFGRMPSKIDKAQPPLSDEEALKVLQQEKAGDLLYVDADGGTLLASSGKMVDLGFFKLSELSGRALKSPSTAKGLHQQTLGALDDVKEGNVFLVQAVNGKYALIRLLQKEKAGVRIQYVYDPSGGLTFEINKVENLPTTLPSGGGGSMTAPASAPVPHSTVMTVGNGLDAQTLLVARDQAIKKLIAVVKGSAKTQQEVLTKSNSIAALGQLRASEAAPCLAENIDFRNSFVLSEESFIAGSCPAVSALIKIGIPGADAAIEQIRHDLRVGSQQVDDRPLSKERLEFRRNLLSLVILKVYGDDLAPIVFQGRIDKAKAPEEKKVIEEALKAIPRVRNWLPK